MNRNGIFVRKKGRGQEAFLRFGLHTPFLLFPAQMPRPTEFFPAGNVS